MEHQPTTPAKSGAGVDCRAGDIDDGLGEGLGCFLRQVVPDAARNDTMLVAAREFRRVDAGVRVRRAIGVAFERDGGHGNHRSGGESLFQIVILRFTVRQSQPPAVIVDDDGDVVGVVERGGAALERGIVKFPLRRGELPDQLRKVMPVCLITGPAPVSGEVILIPPGELGFRRQRLLIGFLAADQVTAD